MSEALIEGEPGTFARAITPMLARVLAQAASAAYVPATEQSFYIVARYTPADHTTEPFNVQPPFSTYAAAEAAAQGLGADYGVFGPFENTSGGFAPNPNQETVTTLQVTTSRGSTFPIPGGEYDAMFFSIQAVEKFVLPYYEQLISPSFADHLLDTFKNTRLALLAHLPWSEYVDIAPTGTASTLQKVAGEIHGHGPAEKQWIPVLIHRDADGNVVRQPIHPPRADQG